MEPDHCAEKTERSVFEPQRQQPGRGLRGLRRSTGMSPLQFQINLPLSQRTADVPLLRIFSGGGGQMSCLRRPDEARGGRNTEN